jgi:hypothetical protein
METSTRAYEPGTDRAAAWRPAPSCAPARIAVSVLMPEFRH